ncbi:hypothetical protein [Stenotrophomonas sp. CFBP 13725]|uniref:hypothetical protein n=1 Tax=Stenotrophomonas sp. CFBP 13725 TaxID=2775297 RepID=UPI00177DF401|nr:hypothetical protein [Stenotrophomonas sp. CFBP 13725]MBD8636743.1 hypothetical protein [Stenotrophomonas sp. CFBP 13725]
MHGLTRLPALLACLLMPLAGHAKTVDQRAAGNLQATRSLPCTALKDVTANDSPADLMAAIPSCIQAGRNTDGADLFSIAGVFAHFDTQRVADRTAHGAYGALKMNLVASFESAGDGPMAAFSAALQDRMAHADAYQKSLCLLAERLGPPRYAPTYMLSHGMSAFTGKDTGLVPGFDAAAAWKITQQEYLKCDEIAAG